MALTEAESALPIWWALTLLGACCDRRAEYRRGTLADASAALGRAPCDDRSWLRSSCGCPVYGSRYGSGFGYESGYGSGDGDGDGYGDGYGSGYGSRYGSGHGSGSGDGITVRHAGVEWSRDRVREVVAEMLGGLDQSPARETGSDDK